MSERPPSRDAGAWKHKPEAKEYRGAMAAALLTARVYDGSEAAYRTLMGQLMHLEETVATSPSVTQTKPQEREIEAALLFSPNHPREINDVLVVAQKAQEKAVVQALAQKEPSKKGEPLPALFVRRVQGVFLPTDGELRRGSERKGAAWKEARFEERFAELIPLLASVGVYTDDLIVHVGQVDPKMMRVLSYAVVEIPRLNRTILVCDQVGEATSVIHGGVDIDTVLSHQKEELALMLGTRIHRVTRHDPVQWAEEIKNLLTTEEVWGMIATAPISKEKVDIHAHYKESVRQQFCQKYPPETWLQMKGEERKVIQIAGNKIHTLLTLFDLSHETTVLNTLLLGQRMYGVEEPYIAAALAIERRTKEEWIERIRASYTSEQWVHMPSKEFSSQKIDGVGPVVFLAPIGFSQAHIPFCKRVLAGEIIYGSSDPHIAPLLSEARVEAAAYDQRPDVSKRTPEEWIVRLKEKHATPDAWLVLTTAQRREIEIDGFGLSRIASKFGLPDPDASYVNLLLFCERIFGKEQPDIQRLLVMERAKQAKHEAERKQHPDVSHRTRDQWIERIKQKATSKEWVEMDLVTRRYYEVDGRGIQYIGTCFGIESVLDNLRIQFLLLGEKIYGANDPEIKTALAIERRTPEEWAEIIKHKKSAHDWVNMSIQQRRRSIDGKKFSTIASVFGLPYVRDNMHDHLLLGEKIYGAQDPFIQSALQIERAEQAERAKRPDVSMRTPKQWMERIKQDISSEEWAGMDTLMRKKRKIDQTTLHEIGQMVGLNDVLNRTLDALLLGEKIYGADDPYIQPLLAAERARLAERTPRLDVSDRTSEQWMERIKQKTSSEAWVHMSFSARRDYDVDGYRIKFIGNIFGIKGVRNHLRNFLLLGEKIYGADDPVIKSALEKYPETA